MAVQDISNTIDFKVYPNHTSKEVSINAKEKILSVSIKDLQGRIVKTEANVKTIVVAELPLGVYLIQVETSKGVGVQKITKTE